MTSHKAVCTMLLVFGFTLTASLPCAAQAGVPAAHGLSGKDVLDLDGSILRRQLQDQAGLTAAPGTVPSATPQPIFTQPATRLVTKYAPPRTLDVYGVDGSAAGGAIHMNALVRWEGHRYPVEVGSIVKGYRVVHIDQGGTDLVVQGGKRHLHIPRPTLDELDAPDSVQVSVAVSPSARAYAANSPSAHPVPVPAPTTGNVPLQSGNTIAMPQPVPATPLVLAPAPAPVPTPVPMTAPTTPPSVMPPPGLADSNSGSQQ